MSRLPLIKTLDHNEDQICMQLAFSTPTNVSVRSSSYARSSFSSSISRRFLCPLSYGSVRSGTYLQRRFTACLGDEGTSSPKDSSSAENPTGNSSFEEMMMFESTYSKPDSPKEFQEIDKRTFPNWSEMKFSNIQEEFQAIDEYEQKEKLPDDDPWPKFLRGAAYEHWGQPKLALAQYALTKHAEGLRLVPDIWERRGYNAFKIGEVKAANAYFDMAGRIAGDAVGNQLHFAHWFRENFAEFMPKNNGPPVPIQYGICKYCVGEFARGRESLVAHIAMNGPELNHALLWILAMSYRSAAEKSDGTVNIPQSDFELVKPFLNQGNSNDQDTTHLFLQLFESVVTHDDERRDKCYDKIVESVTGNTSNIDITTCVYLALYHDAFTRNAEQRDSFLDKVCALEGSASPNDVENFLYHAAKNRLSVPPNSKIEGIPEKVT